MSCCCDACLRRGHLVGRLAARIAGLLDRPGGRVPGLLALDDKALVEAVAGDEADEVLAFLEGFDVAAARSELVRTCVRAVCRHSPAYPPGLSDLDDSPAVLFMSGHGDESALLGGAPAVAVVGARRASGYGLEVARELGSGLAVAGVTVVSGLALGIDAEAHQGCLEGGGSPVAVLGCGPDVVYPATNRSLFDRVRQAGLIVSELPPGQRAFRWSFPARNRIMAALAHITVVVEAAEPSGTLITAQFATELHRVVGAVPGPVTARVSAGGHKLLKDGALVVTRTQDLLDELFGPGWEPPQRLPAPAGGAADAPGSGVPPDPVADLLLEAVEAGLGIDGICTNSGLPVSEARAGLARLEASGHVRRDALGAYRRTALAGRAGP